MLKLIAVVIAGVVLSVVTASAFACNDAYDSTKTPPPQVQDPSTDTQT